jgi:hypothetical protein
MVSKYAAARIVQSFVDSTAKRDAALCVRDAGRQQCDRPSAPFRFHPLLPILVGVAPAYKLATSAPNRNVANAPVTAANNKALVQQIANNN